MKKIFNIIIVLFIVIPFLNVNALSCRGETEDTAIDLKSINSFTCSGVDSDGLVFKSNGNDISKYFEFNKENSTVYIVDNSLTFAPEFKYGLIIISSASDSNNNTTIYIKNSEYKEPTTTTTTTTTKNPNAKVFTVTFYDGNKVDKKTCETKGTDTICNITLPKIDKETFNGWGTAATCKEGNIGTIKVDKDITYYACYKDNNNQTSNTETNKSLFLKTLILKDEKTEEIIDFGTFSIKKKEYTFKVLNEVENINIETTQEEDIKVNIVGNKNIKVGENKILIQLNDKNNNSEEYILNVTRLERGETLNNIQYLKSLVVGGYDINFDKEKFIYNLTIPSNVDKLEITSIAENENFTPKVLNNENLIDGSEIKIIVNEEDSEPTTYVINITKEESTNYLLFIGIGLIFVLIIILIILIIIKKKKSKKTQPTRKPNNDKIEVLNI